MIDIAEPTQWGLNPEQFALRMRRIRRAEDRRRALAARRATPFKIEIRPHVRDTVAPSAEREVYMDGDRTRYRVLRDGIWIELPYLPIQHERAKA